MSVVPTIQCRPQGMTNSTLFSVRRISPVSSWIRSRGTTRWMPLDARTWNLPRSPTRCCTSSVHTPVALTTARDRSTELVAGLLVAHADAGDALALAHEADHARVAGHGRAELGGRAGQRERVAGVVDLGVVVLDGADERVLAQRRGDPQRAAAGQVAVARQPRVPAQAVVERQAGADVGALPVRAQRVEERHRLDEVRGQRVQQQAALSAAPLAPARSRPARGSAGRRGPACSSGSTCRRRSRAPPPAPPTARGWRRPARCPRRRRRRRSPRRRSAPRACGPAPRGAAPVRGGWHRSRPPR